MCARGPSAPDGARVGIDEDGEEREAVEDKVEDGPAVARDAAERGGRDVRAALAEEGEEIDGDEGRAGDAKCGREEGHREVCGTCLRVCVSCGWMGTYG